MAFSWGNPVNWVLARRHLVANLFVDSTDSKRKSWVQEQTRRLSSREFRLDIPGLPAEFSFIVLGDTGEGDSSNWCWWTSS